MATPTPNVETAEVLADVKDPHGSLPAAASSDSNRDSEHDVEKGRETSHLELVGFDGPGDAYDPVYWPNSKKWGVLLVVALMTLITYVHTLEASGHMLTIQTTVTVDVCIRSPTSPYGLPY